MPRGFYKGMLVAAIATCTAIATAFAGGRSDQQERFTIADSNGAIRLTFKTSEGMSEVRMQVHAAIKSGRISWKLEDPRGRIVLRGVGDGGHVSTDTGRMQSLPGTWVLIIEFDDATGRYGYDWHAG